jgi:hypothetical protein
MEDASMTPNDQIATKRVVLAGMKLMYDEKTFPTFKAGMMKRMPMPDKLASEAAGLVKMLQDKASGSIPRQVLLPAAAMLMIEIAKFMKDAKIAKPTPQDIQAAKTKLFQLMAKAFPNIQPRMAPQPSASVGMQPRAQPMRPQQAGMPPPQAPRGLIESAPAGGV